MPAYKHKTQKTIKYKDAPSGYINIEKWEPPFAPVKKGFGYMGVVAEDSEDGTLQCHVCGNWYEQLPTHYTKKHGLTGEEYKQKFGLLSSTALKSKRIRLIQSATITKLQKQGRMNVGNRRNKNGKKYGFTKANKEAANRKGWKKPLEAQNRYGVCDLQIMTKIISLGKKLGKTPTLTDIKDAYGGGIISIMHSRYGSYIKYCRDYLKLEPNYSVHNPKHPTKKSWREELLREGQIALKSGKALTVNTILPYPKNRYIYKFFKNFGDYKTRLLALK